MSKRRAINKRLLADLEVYRQKLTENEQTNAQSFQHSWPDKSPDDKLERMKELAGNLDSWCNYYFPNVNKSGAASPFHESLIKGITKYRW